MQLNEYHNFIFNKLKKSELAKGMFIYSIGSFGSKAINLAIYPLLSFYLIKSDLGYYDLIVNMVYLVAPITTLQLADSIYRFIITSINRDDTKKLISNGFKFILYISLFAFTSLYIILNLIESPIIHVELILLMSFLFSINISTKQIVRGIKKNRSYVISDVLYSLIFVSSLLIFFNITELGIEGVFYSFILTNMTSIIYLWLSTNLYDYVERGIYLNKNICKRLLSYSLPLIPNSLSWWLVASANTWIILYFLGLESNGIYAIAFKFSSVIYLLNKVFSLAWQDKVIVQNDGENAKYNSKVFNYLLFFLLSMAVFIVLFTKPILKFIISEDYYGAWRYVPWLLLGTIFANISAFFGAFYLKWEKTNKIFITTLIGSLTSVVLSIILTKFYGLTGASISIFFGFLTVSTLRYFDTKRYLNLKFSSYLLIPIILLFIVITLIFQL